MNNRKLLAVQGTVTDIGEGTGGKEGRQSCYGAQKYNHDDTQADRRDEQTNGHVQLRVCWRSEVKCQLKAGKAALKTVQNKINP
jgi:hypothetical protein